MVVSSSVWASSTVARGQEERLRIDLDRISHWQEQGAQLSDRVAELVKEARKQA